MVELAWNIITDQIMNHSSQFNVKFLLEETAEENILSLKKKRKIREKKNMKVILRYCLHNIKS